MALAASGGARGGTGAAAPRGIALANYGGGEPNVAPQEGGTCGEPRGASRALRKPDRTAGLRAGASRFFRRHVPVCVAQARGERGRAFTFHFGGQATLRRTG